MGLAEAGEEAAVEAAVGRVSRRTHRRGRLEALVSTGGGDGALVQAAGRGRLALVRLMLTHPRAQHTPRADCLNGELHTDTGRALGF